MTTNEPTEKTSNHHVNEPKAKRGLFPRLPLSQVLELPKAIYEVGQGEMVRRLKVFDYLGKSAGSGSSRALVTISGMYGLTKGSYQADYLELTETGKKLIMLPLRSKGSYQLIYDVLFGNEIFTQFINYWKEKPMPADDLASDWLSRTYKISSNEALTYWEVIKANILDWNLKEELSGKPVIVSREIALQSIKDDTQINQPDESIAEKDQLTGIAPTVSSSEEHRAERIMPKPFGTQILERDFLYGRGRLILPEKMTTDEISKLKLLIDGMVLEVKE